MFRRAKGNSKMTKYSLLELPHNKVDILLGVEFYEYLLEEYRLLVENLTFRYTKFCYINSGSWKSSFLIIHKYAGLTHAEVYD